MKRTISVIALVLGSILAVLAVDAIWVRNLVLNTDRFVAQLSPLAKDPDVQNALIDRVSTRLEGVANLDSRLTDALPPKIAFLAGPIDQASDRFIERITRQVITSDRFATTWNKILRLSHEQVVKALTGGGKFVKTKDGVVTLDLTDVRNQVVAKLQSSGLDVFDKLPAQKSVMITLANSPGLAKAQSFVRILNTTAWILPFVALLLFALSVWLASDHRRALTRVGLGIAIGMAIHLIALAMGRSFYLDLVTSNLPRNAAASVFDIAVKAPRTGTRIVLVVGLLLALASGLAGPRTTAVRIRGAVGRIAGRAGSTVGRLDPVAATGRFVDQHLVAFEVSTIAIGLIVLLAIDQLTARQVLWVAFAVALTLFVLVILASSGRTHASSDESTPPEPPSIEPAPPEPTASA